MSIHNILVPNNLDIYAKSLTVDTLTVENSIILPSGTSIDGDLTIDGNLHVIGNADIDTDLNVDGNGRVDLDMSVGGALTAQNISASSNVNAGTLNVGGAAVFNTITASSTIAATGAISSSSSITGSSFVMAAPIVAVTNSQTIARMVYWEGNCEIFTSTSLPSGFFMMVRMQRINNIVTVVVDGSLDHNYATGGTFYVAIRLPGDQPLLVPLINNGGSAIIKTISNLSTFNTSLANIISNGELTHLAIYPNLDTFSRFADGTSVAIPAGFSITYQMTN